MSTIHLIKSKCTFTRFLVVLLHSVVKIPRSPVSLLNLLNFVYAHFPYFYCRGNQITATQQQCETERHKNAELTKHIEVNWSMFLLPTIGFHSPFFIILYLFILLVACTLVWLCCHWSYPMCIVVIAVCVAGMNSSWISRNHAASSDYLQFSSLSLYWQRPGVICRTLVIKCPIILCRYSTNCPWLAQMIVVRWTRELLLRLFHYESACKQFGVIKVRENAAEQRERRTVFLVDFTKRTSRIVYHNWCFLNRRYATQLPDRWVRLCWRSDKERDAWSLQFDLQNSRVTKKLFEARS